MIPVGYMAKRVCKKPGSIQAAGVIDIYSVSGCINDNFTDYIKYWKHNGYWFFDSPDVIRRLAREHSIDLEGTSLFYYEAYEQEFDGDKWLEFSPEPSFSTNVVVPSSNQLEGFDVVTFYVRTSPECSPLSCNSMAKELPTNAHCLFSSFEEAERHLKNGAFKNCEPGPYRIFAVYSVVWP
jgi:hypothetical protein